MKVKMFRLSGNPVRPEQAEAFRQEWQSGFDEISERLGRYGEATNKALDDLEAFLHQKYNDLTIIDQEMPKTKKDWVALLSDYGNVMVSTHVETGELVLVVADTPF
jgi:hypothetical protein